jgi:hypothetical protein
MTTTEMLRPALVMERHEGGRESASTSRGVSTRPSKPVKVPGTAPTTYSWCSSRGRRPWQRSEKS